VIIRFQSQKIWTKLLSPLFSFPVQSLKSRSWLCNTRDRPLSLKVSFSLLLFAHPDLLTWYPYFVIYNNYKNHIINNKSDNNKILNLRMAARHCQWCLCVNAPLSVAHLSKNEFFITINTLSVARFSRNAIGSSALSFVDLKFCFITLIINNMIFIIIIFKKICLIPKPLSHLIGIFSWLALSLSRWETRPLFCLLVGSLSLFLAQGAPILPPLRHTLLALRRKVALPHTRPNIAFVSLSSKHGLIIGVGKTLVPLMSATRRGQGTQRWPVRRRPYPFVVASCSNR
jgi:hypothetical protein